MRRVLLVVLMAVALAIGLQVRVSFTAGTPALATTPSPVPSCQFAGYDPNGSLVNTTIVCATPTSGAGGGTPAPGTCIGVSTPPAAGTITNLCTPVPLTVSTPLVLTTPGGNSINVAMPTPSPAATGCGIVTGTYPYKIDTTACGGGGGGGTAITFSATPTGTNFNPGSRTASSYFPSNSTITIPSLPGILRIRALFSVTSTTAHSFYGIAVSPDGTNFIDCLAYTDADYLLVDYDTLTTNQKQLTLTPVPSNMLTTGQVFACSLTITVTASNLLVFGGNMNDAPVFGGAALSDGGLAYATALDFSGPLTVYAIGGASTDVISAAYSTSLF